MSETEFGIRGIIVVLHERAATRCECSTCVNRAARSRRCYLQSRSFLAARSIAPCWIPALRARIATARPRRGLVCAGTAVALSRKARARSFTHVARAEWTTGDDDKEMRGVDCGARRAR